MPCVLVVLSWKCFRSEIVFLTILFLVVQDQAKNHEVC